MIPGADKFTTVHLSLSDASGDSAIFEYVNGRLVMHHDVSHQVMTNDPLFEEQLAVQGYWENVPGTVLLTPEASRLTHRVPAREAGGASAFGPG